MTGKVLSLNRVRKARNKAENRLQADENAVQFGLTKAQKALNKMQAEKAARGLDNHKRQK